MTKKLSVIGNSLGLIIDQPILELLKIDRNTLLDLVTDGDALIIRPRRKLIKESIKKIISLHGPAFKKLAE